MARSIVRSFLKTRISHNKNASDRIAREARQAIISEVKSKVWSPSKTLLVLSYLCVVDLGKGKEHDV